MSSSLQARRAESAPPDNPVFVWDDPFLLEDQLSEDERLIRDTARSYARSS